MKRAGTNDALNKELNEIEVEIASAIANENRNKVFETFKVLSETDGTINVNGMWGLKQ